MTSPTITPEMMEELRRRMTMTPSEATEVPSEPTQIDPYELIQRIREIPPSPTEQTYLRESQAYPQPAAYQPSRLSRVLNAIASGAAGVTEGPSAGYALSQQMTQAPYMRAIERYKAHMAPIQAAVEAERARQAGMVQAVTATGRMEAATRPQRKGYAQIYFEGLQQAQAQGPEAVAAYEQEWNTFRGRMSHQERIQFEREKAQIQQQYRGLTPEQRRADVTVSEEAKLPFVRRKAAEQAAGTFEGVPTGPRAARAATIAGAAESARFHAISTEERAERAAAIKREGIQVTAEFASQFPKPVHLSPTQYGMALQTIASDLAGRVGEYNDFVIQETDKKTGAKFYRLLYRREVSGDQRVMYDRFMTEVRDELQRQFGSQTAGGPARTMGASLPHIDRPRSSTQGPQKGATRTYQGATYVFDGTQWNRQ